ncbi:MAG: protein kinase [Acidobacteria bacterium]|nr:protein kinase [Acidobacteriota bacterium]
MSACPTCGATYENSVKICPKDGSVLEGTSEAADPRVGQTLDGKYRLDSRLGAGGMGAIYKATHLMLDKQVAVKLIKPELVTSPDLVRRFQREARAAGNLNHPNIAAAYDLGQTPDGTLYIAMELVNGPSLKDVIRTTGPITVDRAVRIMRQVGSALALAHRHNIIHRDLKPHNIMLATDGRHEVAKLLDFGIAKTFDDASTQLTATGFVLGTPQYMSPEQAAGRPIDGRSDLYSLGIILYEMLIGEVPFNDPSTPAVLVKHLTEVPAPPSRRRPDVAVSPELEAIALRLLAKDPADRFQSADDFLSALPAETGTATAIVTPQYDRTVILPPPGSAASPTGYATTQPPMAAAASTSDATVVTPPPTGSATTRTVAPLPAQAPPAPAPQATLPSTAPRSIPPPAAAVPTMASAPAVAAPAPPRPPQPAAAPPAPASVTAPPPSSAPKPASTEPWAAKGQPSSTPRESRPMRDIIVLVAILLLIVGGVAFGAMQLGLFGGPAEAPSAEPSALMDETPAATPPVESTATPPASQPLAASTSAATPPASAAPAPSAAAASAIRPAPGTRPAATPPSGAPQTAAAPAAPAVVENPAVFFRCTGAAQVCSALRSAMNDALGRNSLRPVANQGTADVIVSANVTVVDESVEQLFGSTFVTRTYSIEFDGQSRGGDLVPMPAAGTLSFDAQVGQQRLQEQSRTMSMTAADNVRAFWRTRAGAN